MQVPNMDSSTVLKKLHAERNRLLRQIMKRHNTDRDCSELKHRLEDLDLAIEDLFRSKYRVD
jgi:hypothetical protein